MEAFSDTQDVLVCYHPAVRGAEALAARLGRQVEATGRRAGVTALPEPEPGDPRGPFRDVLEDAGLLVCVGGDGTVLHSAKFAAITETPIFGIRMGRLGFLTEVTEGEAEAALDVVLRGEARVERRAMVQARVGDEEPVHALNDVVIGRATLGRTVSVGARVDGVLLAEYRADAVLIATATGSTGYALSVGGPILHPASRDVVLVPVAPHLTRANALVLPGDTGLTLFVERGYEAVMTVDGLHERPIASGTTVRVACSTRTAQFVRLGGEEQFYANIAKRLGWLRLDHVMDDPIP